MRPHSINLLIFVFLIGCTHLPPATLNRIGPEHQQAIYVKSTGNSQANLSLWQRGSTGWEKQLQYSATVGRSGIAHEGQKKEGDGFTPGGIFKLGTAFGYAPRVDTQLKYVQVGDQDFWVDDISSPDYNKWVKGPTDAKSYEKLKRDDELYRMAIVINYNMNPIITGGGSAIFFHIWRNYHHPTSGCVAISERHMRKILSHLNKDLKPVIIIER